jgi:hypothetical protein
MDDLWACPPSVLASGPTVLRVKQANPAAALGSAVHACAAEYITAEAHDAEAAARRYGVPDDNDDQIERLLSYMRAVWSEIGRFFPKPMVEAVVEGPTIDGPDGSPYRIKGTVDVCSPTKDGTAIFCDWKSGYIDDGHAQQIACYAYLLWNWMDRPEDKTITAVVAFLRHRYYRVLKYDADTLRQWEYDLTHNVLGRRDVYSPGPRCRWCDMFTTCEARQAQVRSTVDDVLHDASPDDDPTWLERGRQVLEQLTHENKDNAAVGDVLSEFLYRTRLLKKVVEDAQELVRSSVARVGAIPMPSGLHLVMREQQVKQVDPEKAMLVLRNHLSDAQIAQCAKISLPQVLKTYGCLDGRFHKKERRRRIEAALDEADAIYTKPRRVLEEVDLEELSEDERRQVDPAPPHDHDDDDTNKEKPNGNGPIEPAQQQPPALGGSGEPGADGGQRADG